MNQQPTLSLPAYFTSPYEAHTVLTCCLTGSRPRDAAYLMPHHFHDVRDQALWSAMQELDAEDVFNDRRAVLERVKLRSRLPDVHWESYLSKVLTDATDSTLAAMGVYARAVYNNWRWYRSYQSHLDEANRAMRREGTLPPDPEAPDEPASGTYEVWSAADALQPQPPIDWIVEPILSSGSVAVFYGEPGSKKTYSLLSLAVSVACGKPWLAFETRSARTLIVDEESGRRRLSSRIRESLNGVLADASAPLVFVCLAGFQLNTLAGADHLRELIVEQRAELVIIDNLAAAMGGDENSKEDMQLVMGALRRMAVDTGAAIIVIHHSSKSGTYRGSSVIKASPDVLVHVTSEDGRPYINFRTEKNRDGEAKSWSARAVWVSHPGNPQKDQFYLEETPWQERKEDEEQEEQQEKEDKKLSVAQRYVLGYLEQHGPSPLPEIKSAAQVCSPNAARQAVYELVRVGKIERTNPGVDGRGVAAVYKLAVGVECSFTPAL